MREEGIEIVDVHILLPKKIRDKLKRYCVMEGKTLSGFIKTCVLEKFERMK